MRIRSRIGKGQYRQDSTHPAGERGRVGARQWLRALGRTAWGQLVERGWGRAACRPCVAPYRHCQHGRPACIGGTQTQGRSDGGKRGAAGQQAQGGVSGVFRGYSRGGSRWGGIKCSKVLGHPVAGGGQALACREGRHGARRGGQCMGRWGWVGAVGGSG